MYTLADFIIEQANNGDEYARRWLYGDKEEVKESFDLNESTGDNKMFKAYITNLGKYNEGELVGEWLSFPCTEEEWNACLKRIGIDSTYEEYFVTDYDSDIISTSGLGEYPSYEELNEAGEKAKRLKELDDRYGEGFVRSLTSECGIDEVMRNIDDMIVFKASGGDNYDDIAHYYVKMGGGIEEVERDTLESYFDYDDFGRDLGFQTYENNDYDPDDPDSEETLSASQYYCGEDYASDSEIGEACVEEIGGVEELGIDTLQNYFDYEAYGRDIKIGGDFHTVKTKDYEYYWVEFER